MRWFQASLVILFATLGSVGAWGQISIDPDAIYAIDLLAVREQSDIGIEINARYDHATEGLQRLDAAIKTELEDRETALTEARASMPVDEFQTAAAQYDKDVQLMRTQFGALSQAFASDYDARRLTFLGEILPGLAERFRRQLGISVLANRDTILAMNPQNDLTPVFISYLNQFYLANKDNVDSQLFANSSASDIISQSLPIFDDLPFSLEDFGEVTATTNDETPADKINEESMQ